MTMGTSKEATSSDTFATAACLPVCLLARSLAVKVSHDSAAARHSSESLFSAGRISKRPLKHSFLSEQEPFVGLRSGERASAREPHRPRYTTLI